MFDVVQFGIIGLFPHRAADYINRESEQLQHPLRLPLLISVDIDEIVKIVLYCKAQNVIPRIVDDRIVGEKHFSLVNACFHTEP